MKTRFFIIIGITIEEICSNSDVTINDGCIDVTFPDGTSMLSCEQKINK